MPALQSYWLVVHVTTVALASGLLFVPGVASLLYLLRRSGRLAGLAERLPAADSLDRLAYRTTIVAFPLYTFAVIAGAIWAEAAWGRFWGWDPKETVAFVAWVIYAAYLHARATAGWRTGRAAWINVAGFAAMVFNLFFINMVVSGPALLRRAELSGFLTTGADRDDSTRTESDDYRRLTCTGSAVGRWVGGMIA